MSTSETISDASDASTSESSMSSTPEQQRQQQKPKSLKTSKLARVAKAAKNAKVVGLRKVRSRASSIASVGSPRKHRKRRNTAETSSENRSETRSDEGDAMAASSESETSASTSTSTFNWHSRGDSLAASSDGSGSSSPPLPLKPVWGTAAFAKNGVPLPVRRTASDNRRAAFASGKKASHDDFEVDLLARAHNAAALLAPAGSRSSISTMARAESSDSLLGSRTGTPPVVGALKSSPARWAPRLPTVLGESGASQLGESDALRPGRRASAALVGSASEPMVGELSPRSRSATAGTAARHRRMLRRRKTITPGTVVHTIEDSPKDSDAPPASPTSSEVSDARKRVNEARAAMKLTNEGSGPFDGRPKPEAKILDEPFEGDDEETAREEAERLRTEQEEADRLERIARVKRACKACLSGPGECEDCAECGRRGLKPDDLVALDALDVPGTPWSNVDERDGSMQATMRRAAVSAAEATTATVEYAVRHDAFQTNRSRPGPPVAPKSNVGAMLLSGMLNPEAKLNSIATSPQPPLRRGLSLPSSPAPRPASATTRSSFSSLSSSSSSDEEEEDREGERDGDAVPPSQFAANVRHVTADVASLCAANEARFDQLRAALQSETERADVRLDKIERCLDERKLHADEVRARTDAHVTELDRRFAVEMQELKRLMAGMLSVQESTHDATASILYGNEKTGEVQLAAMRSALTATTVAHERHVATVMVLTDEFRTSRDNEAALRAEQSKEFARCMRDMKRAAKHERKMAKRREKQLQQTVQEYDAIANAANVQMHNLVRYGMESANRTGAPRLKAV